MYEPSSTIGIVFGILATLALAAVMLYSARRSMPANRKLGPTQQYLRLHLWGGLAFLAAFLLHTAFGLPNGALTFVLWLLTLWVTVTGVLGAMLQRTLPRVLEPSASFEVNLQRVPELLAQLRARADEIVLKADPRLKTWYEQRLAPEFAAPRMVTAVLLRNPRTVRRGSGDVDILRRTLSPEGVANLDALRELQATKHEMDVHYTLQSLLRGWLFFHVPVSIALLGLVLLHIFFVIYF